ncbi:PhzF family phenazine biosynthesis protein [Streptomyces griseus]|uniref:PhzF family phenazine biosynthesis protein n=1 Tax=Streptomyces stephensoniae TaxID=3375367 RepID=A0ABU2W4T9_9ACTN|nr:PhzF family phenazine biosynthesis protein [Streptomyces griseus]MDT0492873.1 PhzF family phenazine biosynthesis protein [Streptomyces griseus]
MIRYEVVDMFTDRPFAGSTLAVVPDADGLSTEAMGAIAAELNAAETAFVLPATAPDATYRVRVFTPTAESPGGGHSCVGTAATLVRTGAVPAGRVVQECGPARHVLTAQADRATLTLTGPAPGSGLDPAPLLAAVGLAAGDAYGGSPRAEGFGTPFAFLPVRETALARAEPDPARMAAAALPALCLLTWDGPRRTARTRLFAPGFGITEDPACAPVAAALGLWLARTGRLPAEPGSHAYTLRQGAEAGRPALLTCTLTVPDGSPPHAAVTGRVTAVAHGRITTPHPVR